MPSDLNALLEEAHVSLAARDAEIEQLLKERANMLDELARMRATRVWRLASRWWARNEAKRQRA